MKELERAGVGYQSWKNEKEKMHLNYWGVTPSLLCCSSVVRVCCSSVVRDWLEVTNLVYVGADMLFSERVELGIN